MIDITAVLVSVAETVIDITSVLAAAAYEHIIQQQQDTEIGLLYF